MILETAAKFAPIATALIALVASCIALCAIRAQRDIARKRAAIDFFLKTEMDDTLVKLYKRFKQLSPTIKELLAKPDLTNTQEYHDIRAFLSICELIAVGINEGAFSERVSLAYWGDVLPMSYRDAEPLIKQIRSTPGEGTAQTYADLEKLCKKWTRKEVPTGITNIECPPMAMSATPEGFMGAFAKSRPREG